MSPARQAAVLAVDGGNSKADVALVARNGALLASVRGPTVSHQQVGMAEGIARLRTLVAKAAASAGMRYVPGEPVAEVGLYCLAGADFPRETRRLTSALADARFGNMTSVRDDAAAALRAGADQGWGVVLICGAGVNAAGIGPQGRVARLAALGPISGDSGGGSDLGMSALGAAVRARDGRGPRTSLERLVPAHFRLPRPASVTRALYDARIDEKRLGELAPVVFAAARRGDAVARAILDGLADELALMAIAMIRRTRIARRTFDVVLAGGVFANHDVGFFERLAERVHAVAPGARLSPLDAPPVMGAALLGLEELNAPVAPMVARRVREAFAKATG